MRALVKTSPGYHNMELQELPEPKVSNDYIKIKTVYTGICGSDIHTFKGEYNNKNLPVTLGHEFSGEVVEIGPDVKDIKVGDRVTSETTFETCGSCMYCLEKDYNLCSKRKGIGTQADGSFSDYVLSREESCHILPTNVSYKAAALTEPLACCVHAALEKTTILKDDTVLIFGPGPIGLLLAQVVKSQGAKVIISGITRDLPRLNLAKSIGIDVTVNSQEENLKEIISNETSGYGVDKCFDCSGAVVAVNDGLPLTRKKGEFIQVGLFAEKYNAIDQESIIQRELKYIGSRSQKPSSWKIALELLAKGAINVDEMITKVYDLDEWEKGFEDVIAGHEIKVLIASQKEKSIKLNV